MSVLKEILEILTTDYTDGYGISDSRKIKPGDASELFFPSVLSVVKMSLDMNMSIYEILTGLDAF